MSSLDRKLASFSLKQLFEWVSIEFNAQKETIAYLNKKVDALQDVLEKHGIVDKLIPKVTEGSLLKAQKIDVDDLLSYGSNFYGLELTPGGTAYRWTGPERSTKFILPIDRTQERTLEIGIISVISPEVLAEFSLEIDGQLASFNLTGSLIKLKIPSSDSMLIDTEINFTLASTVSPDSLNGAGDTRLLGVAITGLVIY